MKIPCWAAGPIRECLFCHRLKLKKATKCLKTRLFYWRCWRKKLLFHFTKMSAPLVMTLKGWNIGCQRSKTQVIDHVIQKLDRIMQSHINCIWDELHVLNVIKRMGQQKFWEPFYFATHNEPLFDERLSWEGKRNKLLMVFSFSTFITCQLMLCWLRFLNQRIWSRQTIYAF